ncbi:deacetylase-like protein [Cercophora scortea]|uniref:Deacetylase-like protein n=1 Tax=Cercophora scortea TaxID=314031 RepID=A0AAE0M437_9PEZI|nr:deacetylase-like protein [Cercophora scortea]
MLTKTIIITLLAGVAVAFPAPDPIQFLKDSLSKRAPSPGVVISKCVNPGMLALAYDDGPYTYTSQLIDTLDAAGAKGTFFWTGTLYGCIYKHQDAVVKAFKSGHQIASHTWTHSHMGSMSAANIKTEMTKLEQATVNLIGRKPAYMRPPYLDTAGQFLPTMKSLGYKVITDDVDTGDWNSKTPTQSEQLFTSAGAKGNGHIPLMHEVYPGTVNTLTPWLINWAKTNNLKLVTVAECLGDTPEGMYQPGNFTAATGPYSC